jgi:hypothetical protein
MFHQHGFKGTVVVSMGIVLLLVMPVSGVCQSESAQAEKPSEGFYPDKTDTSEKPHNGRGGVLCQNAESIQTSSNGKLSS